MRPWAAALLLGALALGCGPGGESGPGEATEDSQAPDFRLPQLTGGEVTLAALAGRPAVIDFWATWCAPCVHQIPVLNAFHARHGEAVAVLGISVDTGGREVVAAFAEEHDIRYPVALGGPDLAERYGAFGFPTLYVLDARGRITQAHVGVVSEEELEAAVAEAAAGTPRG